MQLSKPDCNFRHYLSDVTTIGSSSGTNVNVTRFRQMLYLPQIPATRLIRDVKKWCIPAINICHFQKSQVSGKQMQYYSIYTETVLYGLMHCECIGLAKSGQILWICIYTGWLATYFALWVDWVPVVSSGPSMPVVASALHLFFAPIVSYCVVCLRPYFVFSNSCTADNCKFSCSFQVFFDFSIVLLQSF